VCVRFWAFLGKGSPKPPQKQKVNVENPPKKIDKISLPVSPQFVFVFIAFSGVFSAMGVQKHYKKRFAKRSC
jgi:hypothetical protein